MPQKKPLTSSEAIVDQDQAVEKPTSTDAKTPAPSEKEIGGPPGPEPTRYGDWEKAGRCIDF